MAEAAVIGVGMMCKPPRIGQAKTRLAAAIGVDAAARLAAAFLVDMGAMLANAASTGSLAPAAYYKPADAAGEIAALAGPALPLRFCDEGDLGASMWAALSDLRARHPAGALLIGSDLPLLETASLLSAADLLREGAADVVIGPSDDGGYWLVGIRDDRPAPLFAPMAWSTDQVLPETLSRARAAGLRVALAPQMADVDDAAGLLSLRLALAGLPETLAPATRAALADIATQAP